MRGKRFGRGCTAPKRGNRNLRLPTANKSLEPMSAAEDVCAGFVALLAAALMAQLCRWVEPLANLYA